MRRLSTSLVFLVLAWFCAQQSQGFVVDGLSWLRGAGRFSHQERLALDVRDALAHVARAEATMAAVDRAAVPPAPALPMPEVVTSKVPLILVSGFDVLPPEARRHRSGERDCAGEYRTREVPVPVPRAWGRAVV